MEIRFLGTGSAWRLPEHSCECVICKKMAQLGEERTRTSVEISASLRILIDPGPDILEHMKRYGLRVPDLVLITHEHGDHYLGMDDLLAYRRSHTREDWSPIPVYASEITWRTVETRFGYLLGSLFEKRIIEPGATIQIGDTSIMSFKTFHGKTAEGSVGYVIIEKRPNLEDIKVVYTSDFIEVPVDVPELQNPDALIIQSHWFNEPVENRPSHMSLQRALGFIKKWKPTKRIFLVHISGGDQVPGDPCNYTVKKAAPLDPMKDLNTLEVYPIPLCQEDWSNVTSKIAEGASLPCRITVPKDGDVFTM